MDPFGIIRPLYKLGPVSISSYFLFLSIGFIVATFIALKRTSRYSIDPVSVVDLSLVSFFSGIIGARVFHIIFERPKYFIEHPLSMFSIWRGGFVWYGGLLFGVVFCIIYIRKKGLPLSRIADLLSIPLSIGLGIGRIGCHFAGCCYGKVTDSWFSVKYHVIDNIKPQILSFEADRAGVPNIPTQLIETSSSLFIALILYLLERRKIQSGMLMPIYVILYAIARFIIEFYRDDFRGNLFPFLSTSQTISIFAVVIAIVILIQIKKIKVK